MHDPPYNSLRNKQQLFVRLCAESAYIESSHYSFKWMKTEDVFCLSVSA